jgi:hypothetical protein
MSNNTLTSSQKNLGRAYARLAAQCHSPNQFLRLNLELEKYLTNEGWTSVKLEVSRAHGRIATSLATLPFFSFAVGRYASGSKLHKKIAAVSVAIRFLGPHRRNNKRYGSYERISHGKGHSLFVNSSNLKNSLLVIWTGGKGRPMMPLSIFLESLRPFGFDVLVLRPTAEDGYKLGVRGFGSDTPGTILAISNLITRRGYQTVFCIGASLGTLPSIQSISLPKLKSIVVVGPVDPNIIDVDGFEAFKTSLNSVCHWPKISIVTGADATRDHEASKVIREHLPSKTLMIRGTGHNPLWSLFVRKRLVAWLKKTLEID